MGVRGLTTFIANRSHLYLEHFELYDSFVVLDGNSIASQLYNWHCLCNDCFGGDYDKFTKVVRNFFGLLKKCNIEAIVIFDGGYETRKLRTVFNRMKTRVKNAQDLNGVTEGSVSVYPLFLRDLFVDIVLDLGVKCVRSDFEGDGEAAAIARTLNCPLISYDSDFYIFDVLYIPFNTVELKVVKNRLSCQVYRVEKFLNYFGGLEKVNLPILAVLLGNDYGSKSSFADFYQHLKMQKAKNQSDQQRWIKSIILWLKNENPESAILKILSRFKLKKRQKVANKIQSSIENYNCTHSDLFRYLNIEPSQKVDIPKLQIDANLEKDGNESSEIDKSSTFESDSENAIKPVRKISKLFLEKFRKCQYPPCFMDIISLNTYLCIQQAEDFSLEHSHSISLEILTAIHKIISNSTRNLTCVARNEHGDLKKIKLEINNRHLPNLEEIQMFNIKKRQQLLLEILNLTGMDFLDSFPNSWSLILISLKYWQENSSSRVNLESIYALIMCSLVTTCDEKIGFYRSTKQFLAKFQNFPQSILKSTNNITESLETIDFNDSLNCMKSLITFFQMDFKTKNNHRQFNRLTIHELAQFQSCLLHIKYLNCLLNFPFPNIIPSFYDGTFIYNMTVNLKKRANLKNYVKLLLENCPNFWNALNLMMEIIEKNVNVCKGQKNKKKRKKAIKEKFGEVVVESEVEQSVFDTNNKFTVLQFVNK